MRSNQRISSTFAQNFQSEEITIRPKHKKGGSEEKFQGFQKKFQGLQEKFQGSEEKPKGSGGAFQGFSEKIFTNFEETLQIIFHKEERHKTEKKSIGGLLLIAVCMSFRNHFVGSDIEHGATGKTKHGRKQEC